MYSLVFLNISIILHFGPRLLHFKVIGKQSFPLSSKSSNLPLPLCRARALSVRFDGSNSPRSKEGGAAAAALGEGRSSEDDAAEGGEGEEGEESLSS